MNAVIVYTILIVLAAEAAASFATTLTLAQ